MAIDKDDVDTCRSILARNQKSVWTGLGESQVQWSLIASIVGLIEACADAERELVKYTASQEKLLFYYLDQFFKVDLRYREFETAVFSSIDIDPLLLPAIQRARKDLFKCCLASSKDFHQTSRDKWLATVQHAFQHGDFSTNWWHQLLPNRGAR